MTASTRPGSPPTARETRVDRIDDCGIDVAPATDRGALAREHGSEGQPNLAQPDDSDLRHRGGSECHTLAGARADSVSASQISTTQRARPAAPDGRRPRHYAAGLVRKPRARGGRGSWGWTATGLSTSCAASSDVDQPRCRAGAHLDGRANVEGEGLEGVIEAEDALLAAAL